MTEECRLMYNDFSNSVKQLKMGLSKHKTIFIRDACIKRFELTFELMWKLLKTFLDDQGLLCKSPRNCLEQAFAFELLKDSPLWIKMLTDRNTSVHAYSEKFSDVLYEKLPQYLKLFEELKKNINSYL